MKQRTVVTGFGPFEGVENNPSGLLASQAGRRFEVLEVSYAAVDAFVDGFDPVSFDRLLMIGVAMNAQHCRLEMAARNQTCAIPDVRGVAMKPSKIEGGGRMRLSTTLWSAEMASEGVVLSRNAGSYLCNYAYYRALQRFPDRKVGFLHVPSVEQMAFESQRLIVNRLLSLIESLSTS